MKIWQILLVIWVVAGCFMLANHFHRENIERDKRRQFQFFSPQKKTAACAAVFFRPAHFR